MSTLISTDSSVPVQCNDLDKVTETLKRFKDGGVKNFQVIADFDMTMTTYALTGTCFGVIRNYPGFPKEFFEKTNAIKNEHYPIHIDYTLPEEVRHASDHRWFTRMLDSYREQGIARSLIPDMLEQSTCRLRPGVAEFLSLAHKHSIPVLVFSGGIRDVIVELLKREGCLYDNISIIANRFTWSADKGLFTGAEEPYITACTKLEVAKQNKYFREVIRDNVLLLGDMVSDLAMGACAQYKEMISVGFCRDPEKDGEKYAESFDVMLAGGNPGFEVPSKILQDIIT